MSEDKMVQATSEPGQSSVRSPDGQSKCSHCGGDIAVRNPRGDCDHLYWPDMLTDEAKIANGLIGAAALGDFCDG